MKKIPSKHKNNTFSEVLGCDGEGAGARVRQRKAAPASCEPKGVPEGNCRLAAIAAAVETDG